MSLEETNSRIGKRLRHKRKVLGLSQTDAGNQLGITFQQVQKYENGSNRISAASLFELCRIYGLNIADLYKEVVESADCTYLNAATKGNVGLMENEVDDLVFHYRRISDAQTRKSLMNLLREISEKSKVG